MNSTDIARIVELATSIQELHEAMESQTLKLHEVMKTSLDTTGVSITDSSINGTVMPVSVYNPYTLNSYRWKVFNFLLEHTVGETSDTRYTKVDLARIMYGNASSSNKSKVSSVLYALKKDGWVTLDENSEWYFCSEQIVTETTPESYTS